MNSAATPDGLIVIASRYGQQETTSRLIAAIESHHMTVMARIDHAAAAAKVGLELRPTELLMFGNPRGGTPLMQAAQTAGIDLPLKALVWSDADNRIWVGYNDPAWIGARHGVSNAAATIAIGAALAAVIATACETIP